MMAWTSHCDGVQWKDQDIYWAITCCSVIPWLWSCWGIGSTKLITCLHFINVENVAPHPANRMCKLRSVLDALSDFSQTTSLRGTSSARLNRKFKPKDHTARRMGNMDYFSNRYAGLAEEGPQHLTVHTVAMDGEMMMLITDNSQHEGCHVVNYKSLHYPFAGPRCSTVRISSTLTWQ